MELHPYSRLFPEMDPEEFSGLVDDIKNYGLRLPILVLDGRILDGRHRHRACLLANVPARFEEFQGTEEEALQYVLSSNLHRRQLSVSQKAAVALELLPLLEEAAEKRMRAGLKTENAGGSAEQAAQLVGVSRASVVRAKFLQENSPELFEQVRQGDTPLFTAIKELRLQTSRDERQALQQRVLGLPSSTVELACGDFRVESQKISAESIDLILSDPPYPREFHSLYADLAVVAERVLKPSGFLVCMTGQNNFPELMNSLLSTGLEFYWLCGLRLTQHGQRFETNMMNGWKPLIVLQKSPRKKQDIWLVDLIDGAGREKDLYEWQQDTLSARKLIEAFSAPEQTVYDPFLGVGSFGVAAQELKRRFIGHELDEGRFQQSVERLGLLREEGSCG